MKKIFIVIHLLFVLSSYGQGFSQRIKTTYSVSLEKPLFYQVFFDFQDLSIQYVKFEVNRERRRLYSSYSIGYGLSSDYNTQSLSESVIPIEYSIGIKKRKNRYKLGAGITFVGVIAYLHLNVEYYRFFENNIFLKIGYLPSAWIARLMGEYEDAPYKKGFHDLRIGIGYQFHDNVPRKVKQMIGSFQSLHLLINPISFTPEKEYRYTSSLEADFLIWENYEHHISTNLGMGFLFTDFFYTKSIFFPMSINYLYGERNHFFEANLYHIYMTNSASYSPQTYHILQPQIGYRYQFNSPIFMRIAYAPYFRMGDWKFRDGMEQSIVFGVGYRFHK